MDHERDTATRQSSVIEDLIGRLEKATGPDLDLDHSIASAIRPTDGHGVLLYTASIDAALTLVPDNYDWNICKVDGAYSASIGPEATFQTTPDERGARPAIALCIAVLKTRAAQQPPDDRRANPPAQPSRDPI